MIALEDFRARKVARPCTGAGVLLVLCVALAGCGVDAASPTPAAGATKESTVSDAVNFSTTGSKPTVSVPAGAAPTSLVIEDLVVGTGPEATKGKQVSVHYVGVHYTDGSQFDASWDRGDPLGFTIGSGQVIAGWDQGVAGMKVGGRRQLTIPSALAYGARGFPPVIQPNETLVFVVDLLVVG